MKFKLISWVALLFWITFVSCVVAEAIAETYTLSVAELDGDTYQINGLPPGAFKVENGTLSIQVDAVKSVKITLDEGTVPPPPPPNGNVARIGTTEYATLAAAAAASKEGDTVFVLPGTHVGSANATAAFERSVTIKGIAAADGSLPILRADKQVDQATRPAWGKGIIVTVCPTIAIENLILEGANVPDDNGAGIRTDSSLRELICRNVVFRGNENGILADPAPEGIVRCFDCEFDKNGFAETKKGLSHNLYANGIQELHLERCKFNGSQFGQEVKSRALKTVAIDCEIVCGLQARAFDISNGGVVEVKTTVMRKGADALQGELIGIAFEGVPTGRVESYLFSGCTMENLRGTGSRVFVHNKSTVEAVVSGGQLIGGGTMTGPVRVE